MKENLQQFPDEQLFEDSRIDRRNFVRLAAATAGALTLPGAATAQVSSDKTTEVYAYVLNHTPTNDQIYTLIELSDASGFKKLRNLGIDIRTIRQPTTAAYAQVTPPQAEKVLGVDPVTKLRFSPGANPFWRLEAYEDGVFPPAQESVDLLDFEEVVQGIKYLEQQNPDRLRFSSIGKSLGRYNFITRQTEPKNIWLTEITNDINDDTSYREKEKVLFYNIDTGERQGPEAMYRFIEDLLAGDEPTIEGLLDDVVLLFLSNNPDGWVAKHPQYYSGERVTDEKIIRTNEYKTILPSGIDPNRTYPTPGYIGPERNPAEPTGSDLTDDQPGVDDDVPEYITETVPGQLDLAEHFRTRDYENLNYVLDLHGQGDSEYFLESFPLNGDYDFADLQGLNELLLSIQDAIAETNLDEMLADEGLKSVFRDINQGTAAEFDISAGQLAIPTKPYTYGTLFDTLGYSTSGDLLSWMCAGEENGGLGLKGYANETVFSIGEFRPKLVEAWVLSNTTLIRTTIEHAARDLEASIETDGASTAYVTTDALTRSSASLPLTTANGDSNASKEHNSVTYETAEYSEEISAGGRMARRTTVTDDTRELSVDLEPTAAKVTLRSISGQAVRSFDPATDQSGFGQPVKWSVPNPESGYWILEFDNTRGTADQRVSATVGFLQTESKTDSPNPRELLGYQQRPYKVTPFKFFTENETYITDKGNFEAVTISDVNVGALTKNGQPRYENVVVIHNEGADNSDYVAALDEYVDTGGNLVLTDRGIAHLGAMDNELAAPIGPDAVFEETLFTSYLGERYEDHPLLADTVPSQSEVGKFVPLGYNIGDDAPMTLVDPNTFRQAGGSIAATTAGEYVALPNDESTRRGVSAGSITQNGSGIRVIGGLLPPATQEYLHPFGLNEYSISHLGMALLTNALGYETRIVGTDGGKPSSESKTAGVTYYQVDFVVGKPIENFVTEGSYANDRLLRFVHGSTADPVMRRAPGVLAYADAPELNERIESQKIAIENGTAKIPFTIGDGESLQLSLVSYEKVGPGWSPATEDRQEFIDAETQTFESGTHTLTVDLPDEDTDAAD